MANAPRLSVVTDQSRPRKLGRYELEERLGGEDGVETFRARVRGLAGFDRIFAVKCLRRPRGTQVNLNDPFIKTARRLVSLNDPRVARVLDADVIDGVAVVVTEFVHGLDLDRFRECAQFSGVLATGNDETGAKWQKIVAYIGAEIAGGLSVMHGLTPPLLHAGLCPRNIVATARGGLKILDAGLTLAAEQASASSPRRSMAYAAPDAAGVEPTAQTDMRALGAMLFELTTGELPPRAGASEMARRVLDSLWPSMADFLASLLSDTPELCPTASEAAKLLAEHWADIPDASMVTEMAALVRNFSAFVADAGMQNTAAPIVQEARPEPPLEPPPNAGPAGGFAIAPPPLPGVISRAGVEPHPFSRREHASGFDDVPTVVKKSGSYAAALFQAAARDAKEPETDEPLMLDGPNEPLPSQLAQPAGRATLLAYPTQPPPPPPAAPEPLSPLVPQWQADPGTALSVEDALEDAFSELAPATMTEPIPELADWGARALAALGDQAGVSVARLLTPPAPAQEPLSSQPPPPPVSDPTIEEAFAFMPPPPAEEPPMRSEAEDLQVEVDLGPRFQSPVAVPPVAVPPVAVPPVAVARPNPLLEDELVDDSVEAISEADQAEPPRPEASSLVRDLDAFPPEEPGDDAPLTATAFEEADATPETLDGPRLAHAMEAPEEDRARHPEARGAARSSANVLGEVEAEALSNATRTRRIAIGVAVSLLLAGGVAGALSAFGVLQSRPPSISKAPPHSEPVVPASKSSLPEPSPVQAAEPALPALPAAAAASSGKTALPVAKAEGKVASPARAPAPTPPPVRAAEPASAPAMAKNVASAASGSGATVTVSLNSKPAGATVWVNGEERGTTPCTVKVLPGGAKLTLIRAGHVSSTSTFDASAGKTIEQTLQAVEPPSTGDARFRAECKTEGRLPIVVDGRETGVFCPNSKLRVEPGLHRIGVLVPATGKVHEKELTLSAGVRSIVFAD